MLDCAIIQSVLSEFSFCEETDSGSVFITHCVYPSFEPVRVFVQSNGEGFFVHDGSGAVKSISLHDKLGYGAKANCKRVAERFDCQFDSDHFQVRVPNNEWLYSAIISVANASSDAAKQCVYKTRSSREKSLISRVKDVLRPQHNYMIPIVVNIW